MKKVISAFCTLALALTIVGCAPEDGGDEPAPNDQANATVTVGLTGGYTSYNNGTQEGNTAYNAWVNFLLQSPWNYFDKDLKIIANTDAVTIEPSEDSKTIKYTIAEESKWSDGTPVTGYDLLVSWAGFSTNLNADPDDVASDPETGAAVPTEDQVWFDGGDGLTDIVTDAPVVNPDNPKEVTVIWSEFIPDWVYSFWGAGVPAHILGKLTLGVEDPTEAAKAVGDAIYDPVGKHADLVKVANGWSHLWDFDSMPDNPDLLVTDGPYIIEDIVKDEYMSLALRPDYTAGPTPTVGHVVFRFNIDAEAGRQALENGELDIYQPDTPTADFIAALDGAEGISTLPFGASIYEHVDLLGDPNNTTSPFAAGTYGGGEEGEAKAAKVRAAFLLTLPRQDIVDKIVKPAQPNAEVMNSFTSLIGSEFYDQITAANDSSKFATRDIEAAKALLEEAGVAGTITVSMVYMNTKPQRVQQYQLIAEAAAEAGFEVTDQGMPPSDVGAAYASGKYDILMFAWQSTNVSFTNAKANFVTGGQNNFVMFSNKENDAIWDQITVLEDPAEQAPLVAQSESLLWNYGFGAPLYQFPGFMVWNSRVRNVDTIPLGAMAVYNFWEWEVDAAPAAE